MTSKVWFITGTSKGFGRVWRRRGWRAATVWRRPRGT